MKTSVSQLNTAEMCLRYWWFEHVRKIKPLISPARKAAMLEGERIHALVEGYMRGETGTVSGAAAEVVARYPRPGQSGIELEKWVRAPWAGANLVGRVDLLTKPGVLWATLARPQKKNMERITDIKVIRSLSWAKTAEQLDHNRQLLAYAAAIYRERGQNVPALIEISHVSVERDPPFHCQAVVRIVSGDQILEREQNDQPLVRIMEQSREEDDFRKISGPRDRSSCNRWYGAVCPYREICTGRIPLPDTTKEDSAGKGENNMGLISPPDAAPPAVSDTEKLEGKLKFRRTVYSGTAYTAVQGERHGWIWELRALGDGWKLVVGKERQEYGTDDFRHVIPEKTLFTGNVPQVGAFDVDRLRKEVLHPVLFQWDLDVSSPKGEPVSTGDDADTIFAEAEQTARKQTETPQIDEAEVIRLISAGATERQARVLVEAGYTLEQLRSGSVIMADLERLRSFGKKTASVLLDRVGATKPEPEPEPEPEPKSGFRIYIGCIPTVGQDASGIITLNDVLRPYLDATAASRRVVDVSLLKAYEWPGMVMERLYQDPPTPCVLVVPQGDPLWDKFSRFFLDRAVFVVVRHG